MANPKPRSVCWPFSKQRSGFPNAGATINRRAEFTLSLCARPSDRVLVGTVIQHRNEWMDSPRSGDEYPVCGRYRFQCVCVSPLKHWLSAAACRQHRFRCCAGMLITMKKKTFRYASFGGGRNADGRTLGRDCCADEEQMSTLSVSEKTTPPTTPSL